jgi:hypothetical protein
VFTAILRAQRRIPFRCALALSISTRDEVLRAATGRRREQVAARPLSHKREFYGL